MPERLPGLTDHNTVFTGDVENDIELLASTVSAALLAGSGRAVNEQSQRQATAVRGATLYIAHYHPHGSP